MEIAHEFQTSLALSAVRVDQHLRIDLEMGCWGGVNICGFAHDSDTASRAKQQATSLIRFCPMRSCQNLPPDLRRNR